MSPYTPLTDGNQIASDLSSTIKDKTILVTGVSPGGLGAEFAITISKHSPALIILAGRDVSKAEQTATKIAEVAPSVRTHILKLDLASQKQVREAAKEVLGYTESIDVLVNNAGIMAKSSYSQTPEGIEAQFGANHIGHFLFTNLIMNKLISAEGIASGRTARVVNVASDGYRLGPVRFDDWNFDVLISLLSPLFFV
jgi:NAD(P)-dependent dehydrogenase (short-subunit alcohol dehydrogenase family)